MNYPGNLIKQGSKGDDVKAIQQQLIDTGFGPLTADGDYGPGTLKAVQAFQSAKGLTADGVIGSTTWGVLFPESKSQPSAVGGRDAFFHTISVSLFSGNLKQSQKDGMNAILDEWGANYNGSDTRYLAYMLATTFHETANTMQPIAEYGKGAKYAYGVPDPETGQTYYGRGFVQLTWKNNYAKFGQLLGLNLVGNPDLAMGMAAATQIMFIGMTKGMYTGKKLADYLNSNGTDWVNARRIINGTDKAERIAGYAEQFYTAIASLVF